MNGLCSGSREYHRHINNLCSGAWGCCRHMNNLCSWITICYRHTNKLREEGGRETLFPGARGCSRHTNNLFSGASGRKRDIKINILCFVPWGCQRHINSFCSGARDCNRHMNSSSFGSRAQGGMNNLSSWANNNNNPQTLDPYVSIGWIWQSNSLKNSLGHCSPSLHRTSTPFLALSDTSLSAYENTILSKAEVQHNNHTLHEFS